MNRIIILVFIIICSCNEKKPVLAEIKSYDTEIAYTKKFARENNKNQEIAFMIDYSLHSGKNRFFIVDLKKNRIIRKALVCHGSCKNESKNNENATVFSNTNESLCTSLGMAAIGERDYSKWGKNYKYWLDRLETSNSNMRKRVVVLHAWEHVPDNEIYPKPIVMSWGCPTVSIKFLDELDDILKKNKKVLLYSFN